jgi:1,4-dihydroxy-2-naphthoate octaprenyltransferase
MVLGTHFVLTGSFSWTAVIASMVPFFLVNNLLLLNQFPDVDADKTIGRRHFPILIGRRASSLIYGAFLLLSFVSICVGVVLNLLPFASLLGLLALALAVPAAIGAYRYADNIERLVPHMGQNVMINIITPVLVAAGLFIDKVF